MNHRSPRFIRVSPGNAIGVAKTVLFFSVCRYIFQRNAQPGSVDDEKYAMVLLDRVGVVRVRTRCLLRLIRTPNTAIMVTSNDLDSFTPVNTGSVDFYTADFRLENPTNRTFENIEVGVTLMPVTPYCHSQSATFDVPSMTPKEKVTEVFSFSEFADLDCAYNFTSSVTSDDD